MMMTMTMMAIMVMMTMMATIVFRVSSAVVADPSGTLIPRLRFGSLRENLCKVQLVQPELARLVQPPDGVP